MISLVVFFDCYGSALDEMGNRIDDLEKSVADLMMQAGVDESEKADK